MAFQRTFASFDPKVMPAAAKRFGGLEPQYSEFCLFYPDLLKKSVTASNPS